MPKEKCRGCGGNVNQDALERILEEEVGYSKTSAKNNAKNLLGFQSRERDDLDTALHRWIANRDDITLVSEGIFNTLNLLEIGLTYPAALMFIDWARSDPAFAAKSLGDRANGLSSEQKS